MRASSGPTAALQMNPGMDRGRCRTPEILSDAAHLILILILILIRDPKLTTGNFFIDDELLAGHGVTDSDPACVTAAITLEGSVSVAHWRRLPHR